MTGTRETLVVTSILALLQISTCMAGPLDGVWKAVQLADGTKQVASSDLQDIDLTISNERYVLAFQDGSSSLGISINQIANPAQIDLVPLAGINKDRVFRGIFDLRSDELRIAYAAYDQPRPTNFQTKEGMRLEVWKRVATNRQSIGTEHVVNSLKMEFTLVLPGTFLMGTQTSEQASFGRLDETQRRITISRPFYLGVHEVTRGEYREFINAVGNAGPATPGRARPTGGITSAVDGINRFDPGAAWDKAPFPQEDNHPVVYVSWDEAVAFCEWLSRKEGKTYRLPTEAEWEYAARGGATSRYWWGDDPEDAKGRANIGDRSYATRFPNRDFHLQFNDGYVFTAPVGSYHPNAFGLYDMIGNVFEWVQDWYSVPAVGWDRDPKGPDNGQVKIAKGGGWGSSAAESRIAFRFTEAPSTRWSGLGFRVLLQVD